MALNAFYVSEDAPVGTIVGQVTATGDGEYPVSYELSPGMPFAVDASTGVIKTTGLLDYETRALYEPMVTVLGVELPISISVLDVVESNGEAVREVLSVAGGVFAGESDPSIVGAHADPDGNGDSNIYELWRGTDVSSWDSRPSGPLLKLVESEGLSYGACELEVSAEMDDLLAMRTEISFDLKIWRNVSNQTP